GSVPGRHRCDSPRRVILAAIAAIAAAYQVVAILACVFRKVHRPGARGHQPVSVLKPTRGIDPGLREAIRSHTDLHGDYEFLCGVSDPQDPARALLAEFFRARVVECPTQMPNGNVGVLMDLAAA